MSNDLERAQREVRALERLASELGSAHPLDRQLAIVLECVRQVFERGRAAVLARDERSGRLSIAANAGFRDLELGRDVPASDDAADLLTSIGVKRGLRQLAIPLRSKDRTLGVLLVDDGDGDRFQREEEVWLRAIASHATHALERARLEKEKARLFESQKMAALVHLVAGITHEMNSPLGTMVSASDTIERAVAKIRESNAPPSAGVLTALSESSRAVGDASRRIDGIVRRLKSFVRLDEAGLQEIGIETCIEDALALLRHRLDGISIVRDYANTSSICCHPARLNEVFSTILRNACDAVQGREGAKIVVRTRAYRDSVCVEIDDNGVGMSEEEIQRVFDPGFTTRDGRVRMGLGLAIAHQVVGDYDGEIEFESQIGFGTKVSIELPIASPEPV